MKKNNEVLIALNLPTLAVGMKKTKLKKRGTEKAQADSKEYVPGPEEEQRANDDLEILPEVCRS